MYSDLELEIKIEPQALKPIEKIKRHIDKALLTFYKKNRRIINDVLFILATLWAVK